jgi:hypothetical protein
MPVRFRCTECFSTLSTARRKAGTTVVCPNCLRMVNVPLPEVVQVQTQELVAVGGNSFAGRTKSEVRFGTGATLDLEAMPLFERSDFEQMLNPAIQDAAENEPTEEPAPQVNLQVLTPQLDGFLVMRSTVTVLTAAVVVLIALAFTAGVLVGSR